jgi:hypothetical protein
MLKRSIFHLAWLLSLSLTASAARGETVQEFVLDNGLKVLLLEDHKSPSVTFQVWYPSLVSGRLAQRKRRQERPGAFSRTLFVQGYADHWA